MANDDEDKMQVGDPVTEDKDKGMDNKDRGLPDDKTGLFKDDGTLIPDTRPLEDRFPDQKDQIDKLGQNPDDPADLGLQTSMQNRILEGPPQLEQLLFRAETVEKPNLAELATIDQLRKVRDKLQEASEQGENVSRNILVNTSAGVDPTLLAGQIDLETQRLENERKQKEEQDKETQKKEDAEREKAAAKMVSDMATAAIIGSSAFVGDEPLQGVGKETFESSIKKLPEFLKNVAPIAGMSAAAMTAATAIGNQLKGIMGDFLENTQSMGGEAYFTAAVNSGLSKSGKQKSVDTGIPGQ